MKKIKYILFIVLLFLSCGCSAKYQVFVENDKMIEQMTITVPNNYDNKEKVKNNLNFKQSAYYDIDRGETNYYTKTLEEDEENLYLKYSYTYRDTNLEKSSLMDYCFYKKSVAKNDNIVSINTTSGASCLYKDGVKQLDKLTIEIITDNYVIENNADKVKGNKYIWVYNDKNFQNKLISIKIDLNREKEKFISSLKLFIIIFGGFLLILSIFILNIYIKHKKNNRD